MIRFRSTVVALALLGVGALSAEAQVEEYRWQVAIGGGWQTFPGGSAVESGASLNGEGSYFITEAIGLGLYADFTFTETDGRRLTPAALSFVDSTTFTIVNQGIEIFQYGAQVKLRLPSNTSPFILGGVGGYTVFFDPQQNNDPRTTTGLMVRFGAGVDFAVGQAAGFQLAVHDSWYPSWSPNRLLPVEGRFLNTRFPELNPDPDALDDSVHNIKFLVSVTLLPGAL